MKTTRYFDQMRARLDRALILDEWIAKAIGEPISRHVQADGRIRIWTNVPEAGNKYIRVVLLADGETVHNAFFDRRFAP